MHILPIASGKGGVGKSLIAANLAIALAQAGKKVYLADLDLGGSNLHLILGAQTHERGLGAFITRSVKDFQDCVSLTDYANLLFISGDSEIPGLANLPSNQKKRVIRGLTGLEGDYLILDLGAGTGLNTIDFFLASGSGIIVTTPTPTATVNAYLFLKNAVFRIVNTVFRKGTPAGERLDQLRRNGSAMQRLYIPRFVESIRNEDPASYHAFRSSMDKFHPRMILNMVEDPRDADKASRLRRSCQQYLGVDLEHLGIVYRDDLQDVALGSRLPIIIYKPNSVLSQAIYRLADKLIQTESTQDRPLDLEALEESFSAAEMEAAVDFEAKMNYVEELLHSGALSMGDLMETIKTQQFELAQLKKENQFLKSKLVKMMSGAGS
jgi:flagellar biosynthesis protein FlhG